MYSKKSRADKRWRKVEVDRELSSRIARELGCSPVLADLLVARAIASPEEAQEFLNPRLDQLADPELLPDQERAVARIARALQQHEHITIFGDYDVDGICSTALLLEFCRFLGHQVHFYIPRRLDEGYGLSCDAIRKLADEGTELIITVDNGSSSVEEIALAKSLGMDVVVTDHHLPSDPAPEPDAFVNPWLAGSRYPFPQLAGVGVVFKLIWGICRHFSRSRKVSPEFKAFMMEALAYVALGTVSDVVSLRGENRVLVHFGLRALACSSVPGLQALVKLVNRKGTERRAIEAADVAFRIGPCLNSAGRLGDASLALQLLITRDPAEAESILARLVSENDRRRRIEKEIHTQARQCLLESVNLESDRAIVLAGEGWHPGVIGIVASRIVDEFYRPTLLIALDGKLGKGSARSIPQVQIRDALERASGCLEGFGGHAQAAGVRVSSSRVDELRTRLNNAIDISIDEMVPEIIIDGECGLSEWTPRVLGEIARLAPFGQDNREPLFACHDAEIAGFPKLMGREGAHLSFYARQGGCSIRTVAFGMGELHPALASGKTRVSLVYQPVLNRWRNEESIELLAREIKLSS